MIIPAITPKAYKNWTPILGHTWQVYAPLLPYIFPSEAFLSHSLHILPLYPSLHLESIPPSHDSYLGHWYINWLVGDDLQKPGKTMVLFFPLHIRLEMHFEHNLSYASKEK